MPDTDASLKARLLNGEPGPYSFSGLLNLNSTRLTELPQGISCYELSAKNSKLITLPDDIQVTNRISLDHSNNLVKLPAGLKTGSLSLEGCNALEALPEGLNLWFLNLDNCMRFKQWPATGEIRHGTLSLRNCVELQSLPAWLGELANLNLAGCSLINNIPNGLTVNGWVDVGGSAITSLPSSLDSATVQWRGVPVSREIAFNPDAITSKQVLAAPNAEVRRVMIERMGYLEFATQSKARTLDVDKDAGGERKLLKIGLEDDEDLVGLSCFCPSTGRQYFLRVPPDTKSCHQAAAWIAGFDDPSQYAPIIET